MLRFFKIKMTFWVIVLSDKSCNSCATISEFRLTTSFVLSAAKVGSFDFEMHEAGACVELNFSYLARPMILLVLERAGLMPETH